MNVIAKMLKEAGFNVPKGKEVTHARLLKILREYRQSIERNVNTNVPMTIAKDHNGKTSLMPKYLTREEVLEVNPSIESLEVPPSRLDITTRDYVTGKNKVTVFYNSDNHMEIDGYLEGAAALAVLLPKLETDGLLHKVVRYYGVQSDPYCVIEHRIRNDGQWSSRTLAGKQK